MEVKSSIRRINDNEIFSNSSHGEEDDEEALKWAAIQRLPTFDRLKKGILTSSTGESVEVNIQNLGLQERRYLLEKLVKVTEEDNEKFLLKLKNRIDRVGINLPTIEVRYEQLNVEEKAYGGSRATPSLLNFGVNIVQGFLNRLHIIPSGKVNLPILRDVSGIIKPSRLTLLLGPPSSGKTTLLLALAGKLDPNLKFSGSMTYNGHGMKEFIPQRTASYISQHDLHIGEMTVRETLQFSAKCQGVGTRHDMLAELLRREKEANIKPDPDIDVFMKAVSTKDQEANMITDYVLKVMLEMKILGLEICADIMVGNAMVRGISGGQRKRLTTGEMLVGSARALFMDEISNGLDSSTTFQIVKSIMQYIHIFNGTAVISLLQPAPETFDLFDDIILLSEGYIVYQGPRENVLEFFEYMGFKCPERKGVADFLQEVTSKKDQKQYWSRTEQPYSFVTVKEFAEAFQSFHVGRSIGDEMATPFDKAKSHPAALATKRYGAGKMKLFKYCFAREFLLMKRNSFVHIFKLVQYTIMAVVAMLVFLHTEMHRDSVIDGGIYSGALFYSLSISVFNGLVEMTLTVAKLPVFYKQRDYLFYPAWAFSLPHWILKIPMTLVDVVVWVSITYYGIGYDPDFGRFFRQFLLLIFVKQMASSMFRFIAAAGRNIMIASNFGSFVLLLVFASGGFVLSGDRVKKWWKWAYWISPLMYGQNALAVNEFLGKSWSHVPPNSTEALGMQVLKSRGFFTDGHWYWIGLLSLIGLTLVFNFGFTLALAFLDPLEKPQSIVYKETQSNELPPTMNAGRIKKGNSYTSTSMRMEAIDEAGHSKKKGMVLPFEPHYVTFDDITYSVDMPQVMKNRGALENKLVLLKNVSGAFRPGILTALMGISGAGKTTLMDVLAGRKTGGYTQGSVTISGYLKNQKTFARISGYCEQNDIHSPHVTVNESLVYSAWLRLPPKVDSKTRKMFIEEVMELVELNPIREAIVGFPGVNGLSTEQRKRLTIAVELVANPSIIFMDEPTSGLDARAAAIVMRTVRNTVDTGRTVVCTIHQPSIDIFESFDELLLLKKGGQEIYVGPLGRHSSHMIKYFEGMEGVRKIKDGYNPATWMLEVTSSAQETALGIDFADIYRNSELYRKNKAIIEELSTPAPGSKDLYFPTQYSQPFFIQCIACLWKQHWSYWRNSPYNATRFLFTTLVAVVFGTMFWNLGSKIERRQDIFNAMGSMYDATLSIGITNAAKVQPLVAVERTVFYRERAAGMYSAFPYAFAQVIIELPYNLVQAVIYGVIVYTMIGFELNAVKFFWYLFFVLFTFLYFTFYGMMCIAVAPNQHISSIVASGSYSMWSLFSGFIVPRTRIPIWWRWYSWASPFSWTLYGLVGSQFGDTEESLEGGKTVEAFVRDYFGFKHEFLGVVAAAVVGFGAIFAFVFAISIKLLNFQKR